MQLDDTTLGYVHETDGSAFASYMAIIRRLRAPDGCPWDRKQTLESLRTFLVEETFETVAAIDALDPAAVAEEVGDVLLVSLLIGSILEERSGIPVAAILRENGQKLLRRHPHVFGALQVTDADEVIVHWNRIKEDLEGKVRVIETRGKGLPPLSRAMEIQKAAAKQGFDWPDIAPIIGKIREETAELETEINAADSVIEDGTARVEEELGDLLFSVVNLARKLKIDPSLALERTNRRFAARFAFIEDSLAATGSTTQDVDLERLDELWNEAKRAGV